VIQFTVFGAPRTKKNSNRLVKAGKMRRILPSKAWTQWVETARTVRDGHWMVAVPETTYNIRAIFYRDALRGDAVGYYQGLADLLEKRGILSDDKWLVSWDGSRLAIDRENPRVEITLEPVDYFPHRF